jgi:endogenous inhibitor of DNA gyrase (YacG/DUF329 family)
MINVTCPICGGRMQSESLADWPEFPFCSQRCKTVDLGRWLSGAYSIPAEEPEELPDETDHP